jgi:hypothetical protein
MKIIIPSKMGITVNKKQTAAIGIIQPVWDQR